MSNMDPAAFVRQYKLFLGFDWAMEDHDVVGLDSLGRIVMDQSVEDSAEGWAAFRQKLADCVGADLTKVAVAVETCNGPAVERLLEMGCDVYPLNPKAAKRYRERKSVARADQFCGTPAVTRAKSRLAVALAGQLQLLEKQLREYRQTIEALFGRHPDHDIFGSLPGLGAKTPPRLAAEIGSIRERFENPQSLQTYGGTAPVTQQSGKSRRVKFRRACNKHLRSAVGFLADHSRKKCVWAQVYYERKRDQGMSHACALRCLGQRWLKIVWKMWQTRTAYDEALHTRSQTRHGSWVVALQ